MVSVRLVDVTRSCVYILRHMFHIKGVARHMAHRYGISVPVEHDTQTGWPRSFTWHGATYDVAEVVANWYLLDRWREAGNPFAGKGYSDRTYCGESLSRDGVARTTW